MMTMMKRNRKRPLVESSKLWDRRQQSCVIHNVEAESAGLGWKRPTKKQWLSKALRDLVQQLGALGCEAQRAEA